MNWLKKRFAEGDKIARALGIEVVEIAPGYALARLTLDPAVHMNAAGICHGATIFALADIALAAASNSHGRLALAVGCHIAFMKPGIEGVLTAQARELTAGKTLGTYLVEIANEDGGVIASMQGTVFRLEEEIEG